MKKIFINITYIVLSVMSLSYLLVGCAYVEGFESPQGIIAATAHTGLPIIGLIWYSSTADTWSILVPTINLFIKSTVCFISLESTASLKYIFLCSTCPLFVTTIATILLSSTGTTSIFST